MWILYLFYLKDLKQTAIHHGTLSPILTPPFFFPIAMGFLDQKIFMDHPNGYCEMGAGNFMSKFANKIVALRLSKHPFG